MSSTTNGHNMKKAFYNDQGNANNHMPHYYTRFEDNQQNPLFTILFNDNDDFNLSEFRVELFSEFSETKNAYVKFYGQNAELLRTEVCNRLSYP